MTSERRALKSASSTTRPLAPWWRVRFGWGFFFVAWSIRGKAGSP